MTVEERREVSRARRMKGTAKKERHVTKETWLSDNSANKAEKKTKPEIN